VMQTAADSSEVPKSIPRSSFEGGLRRIHIEYTGGSDR